MRNTLLAESTKAVSTPVWLYMIGGGVLLSVVSAYGFVSEVEADSLPTQARADLTGEVVRAWMTMHLLSSLFGAVYVAQEYGTGTISRSVLLGGGRGRIFTAKALVAAAMGAVFGAVAFAGALVSPMLFMPAGGFSAEWTTETWQTAAGVFAVTALAVPWGAMVGWIVRNRVAAVLILVLLTMGLEPYLLRAVPEVAKYLMTIAMSSVYLDGKPELLSVPWALAVIGGWIAALGAAGFALFRNRDIV